MIPSKFIAASLMVILAGPALAGRVAGAAVQAPPDAAALRQLGKPHPSGQARADHDSLREGVIAEIEDAGARLKVNGSWLSVADGTTRIFRRGAEVRRSTLVAGQSIRFTLAPGISDRLTLGVVYAP